MKKGLFYWLGAIASLSPVIFLNLPIFLILIYKYKSKEGKLC